MKISANLLSLCGLLLLAACAAPQPDNSSSIPGTVQNTGLSKDIQAAEYVLLGEKHDNPKHHEIQANILKTFLNTGDLVVFEMINSDQQPVIDEYLAGRISNADLEARLNWKDSGWPSWDYYGPLFFAAKAAGANILYGSYPRKVLMKKAMLKIARPKILDDDMMRALDAEIETSHCGMLPPDMIRPMSNLQILKDDLMSRQLLTRPNGAKAFLIAGNGHTRKDRAVPKHLAFSGAKNIFVLGLIEENAEPDEWELFSTYDAIWITEGLGLTHEDYCNRQKALMKKKFG